MGEGSSTTYSVLGSPDPRLSRRPVSFPKDEQPDCKQSDNDQTLSKRQSSQLQSSSSKTIRTNYICSCYLSNITSQSHVIPLFPYMSISFFRRALTNLKNLYAHPFSSLFFYKLLVFSRNFCSALVLVGQLALQVFCFLFCVPACSTSERAA